jgi:hypothetical protein
MKKEFVHYELAVKLKELGFDERCLFAFDNCSTPMRCTDLRTSDQKFNGVNYNSSSYTSQPTFSQAFRWFREKYNLYSFVFKFDEGFGYETFKEGVTQTNESFDTYDEAELACLTKLIEIVEQQKQN